MMEYKGYVAKVVFDDEAGIFHGEVINTRDVITFQGECVNDLRTALIDSVEDYLEFCEQRGEKPGKPFSGKFLIRVDPELHQKIYIKAAESGTSINQWISSAIEKELER